MIVDGYTTQIKLDGTFSAAIQWQPFALDKLRQMIRSGYRGLRVLEIGDVKLRVWLDPKSKQAKVVVAVESGEPAVVVFRPTTPEALLGWGYPVKDTGGKPINDGWGTPQTGTYPIPPTLVSATWDKEGALKLKKSYRPSWFGKELAVAGRPYGTCYWHWPKKENQTGAEQYVSWVNVGETGGYRPDDPASFAYYGVTNGWATVRNGTRPTVFAVDAAGVLSFAQPQSGMNFVAAACMAEVPDPDAPDKTLQRFVVVGYVVTASAYAAPRFIIEMLEPKAPKLEKNAVFGVRWMATYDGQAKTVFSALAAGLPSRFPMPNQNPDYWPARMPAFQFDASGTRCYGPAHAYAPHFFGDAVEITLATDLTPSFTVLSPSPPVITDTSYSATTEGGTGESFHPPRPYAVLLTTDLLGNLRVTSYVQTSSGGSSSTVNSDVGAYSSTLSGVFIGVDATGSPVYGQEAQEIAYAKTAGGTSSSPPAYDMPYSTVVWYHGSQDPPNLEGIEFYGSEPELGESRSEGQVTDTLQATRTFTTARWTLSTNESLSGSSSSWRTAIPYGEETGRGSEWAWQVVSEGIDVLYDNPATNTLVYVKRRTETSATGAFETGTSQSVTTRELVIDGVPEATHTFIAPSMPSDYLASVEAYRKMLFGSGNSFARNYDEEPEVTETDRSEKIKNTGGTIAAAPPSTSDFTYTGVDVTIYDKTVETKYQARMDFEPRLNGVGIAYNADPRIASFQSVLFVDAHGVEHKVVTGVYSWYGSDGKIDTTDKRFYSSIDGTPVTTLPDLPQGSGLCLMNLSIG